MARLNKQGHEIWFEKVLWSYLPIHWKGWAFTALLAAAAIGTVFTLSAIIDLTGHAGWDALAFLPLAVLFPWSWRFIERHC